MIHFNYSILRRNRSLLFRFLSILCLYISINSFSTNTFAQGTCGNIQCTSNDVRIISAYISAPDNLPIDCGATNPFDGAELHLIVSSNTQRIGISLAGVLNIINTTVNPNTITASFNVANCFTGVTLNNGSNNNLVYDLGSTLDGVQCGPGFSLSDVFISWGTGNTDFCMGSSSPQCPATPAKCRFNPGETIPVTVKLDVDFGFHPGVCNEGGNSLALNFTPSVTAQNITYPLTFTWDFGDGSATVQTTAATAADVANAGTSYTYAAAGTYTATLTVSDASDPAITKTAVHTFILTACCNLDAPQITAGPFCSADQKTIADLPQTDGNGGTYHWYNAADPDNSFELPGNTLLVDGTTYYVSVSSGTCESARTAVTITINPTPPVNGNTSLALCVGKTFQLDAEVTTGGTYTATNGNATVSASGLITGISAGVDTIIYVVSSSGCSNTDSAFVTVNGLPDCTISASNNSHSFPVGTSVTYSTSTSNLTYSWSVRNSSNSILASSKTASITYNFTSVGNFTVYDTVTNTNGCTSYCSYSVTVNAIGPSIAYTQGFYGNNGGKACNGQYSYQIMQAAVTAAGGSIRFGNQSDTRSFTLMIGDVNNGTKSNVYKMLPGGKTPSVLKSSASWKSNCAFTTASFANSCTWPGVPMTPAINNVLLAQTMALRFNLYYNSTLGSITLTGNVLTFAKPTKACGSTYSTTGSTQTIPCSVFNYLTAHGGATIMNLYNLANDVLGGVITSISPSDMNNALNVINTGFDGGAQIIAVSTSPCIIPMAYGGNSNLQISSLQASSLSVSAFPNPFTDKVTFSIVSPISGKASLDIYNIMGQKLHNVYQGYLFAGRGQVIEYNVPSAFKGALIYTLKVGNQQVNGKLMQIK